MLLISRSGFSFSGSAEDLTRMAAEFCARGSLRITGFLHPPLLHLLQAELARSRFHNRTHGRIGVEACMESNAVAGLLHFVVNNRDLFRVVESISGCGPIGCFSGRVYRMVPGRGHYDSWHGDVGEGRLVGMSLNLSTEVFAGSCFQIRTRGSVDPLSEVANTGFGDALLFPIGPGLEHRITPLEGDVPKTAFAGWFCSHPDYRQQYPL